MLFNFKTFFKIAALITLAFCVAEKCFAADIPLENILEPGSKLNFDPDLGTDTLNKWRTRAQEFIDDPKNSSELNTPDGRTLREMQTKVTNYLIARTAFEKCHALQKEGRQLGNRALSGIAASSLDSVGCYSNLSEFPSIQKLDAQIERVENHVNESELKKTFQDDVIKNTADSYLYLQTHYRTPGPRGERDVSTQKVLSLCDQVPDGQSFCKNEVKDYLGTLPSLIDSNQAAFSINRLIDNFQTKNLTGDDRVRAIYQNQLQGEGSGILLLTQTLQQTTGAVSSTQPLKQVDAGNVTYAVEKAKDSLGDSFKKIDVNNNDAFLDLIQSNPAITAQILSTHPEYAPLFCKYFTAIAKRDQDRKNKNNDVNRAVLVGGVAATVLAGTGLAAGIILSATGIGAPAGIPLAAISAAALTSAAVVGGVSGGVSLISALNNVDYNRQQMSDFESAYLSKSGDGKTFREAQTSLNDFNQSVLNAAFSGVFVVLDATGFEFLGNKAAIQGATQVLKDITKQPAMITALKSVQSAGINPWKFVERLVQLTKSQRDFVFQEFPKWTLAQKRDFILDGLDNFMGTIGRHVLNVPSKFVKAIGDHAGEIVDSRGVRVLIKNEPKTNLGTVVGHPVESLVQGVGYLTKLNALKNVPHLSGLPNLALWVGVYQPLIVNPVLEKATKTLVPSKDEDEKTIQAALQRKGEDLIGDEDDLHKKLSSPLMIADNMAGADAFYKVSIAEKLRSDSQLVTMAELAKDRVPGGNHFMNLADLGFMTKLDAAKILAIHSRNLAIWSGTNQDNVLLPQIDEMQTKKILTSDQAVRVNRLARTAFNAINPGLSGDIAKSQQDLDRLNPGKHFQYPPGEDVYKWMDGNTPSLLPSLQKLPKQQAESLNDQAKEILRKNMASYTDKLVPALNAAVNADPQLSKLSNTQKSLISKSFSPVFDISDSALWNLLLHDPRFSDLKDKSENGTSKTDTLNSIDQRIDTLSSGK